MTDRQPWKLKVSLYFYGRTRKLYMTLSFCHSSLFWLIYCPVWHWNPNSFRRKISFFILCLHITKYMRKPNQKCVGFCCFFPICCPSTNNTLIPPAGELHMLMSPDSRDESCSAPGLLAGGKWLQSEFMHDCPAWCVACQWFLQAWNMSSVHRCVI